MAALPGCSSSTVFFSQSLVSCCGFVRHAASMASSCAACSRIRCQAKVSEQQCSHLKLPLPYELPLDHNLLLCAVVAGQEVAARVSCEMRIFTVQAWAAMCWSGSYEYLQADRVKGLRHKRDTILQTQLTGMKSSCTDSAQLFEMALQPTCLHGASVNAYRQNAGSLGR